MYFVNHHKPQRCIRGVHDVTMEGLFAAAGLKLKRYRLGSTLGVWMLGMIGTPFTGCSMLIDSVRNGPAMPPAQIPEQPCFNTLAAI